MAYKRKLSGKIKRLRKERRISEEEIELNNDAAVVQHYLTRAAEREVKSATVEIHILTYPLVWGWTVEAIPSDSTQAIRTLRCRRAKSCFDGYRYID